MHVHIWHNVLIKTTFASIVMGLINVSLTSASSQRNEQRQCSGALKKIETIASITLIFSLQNTLLQRSTEQWYINACWDAFS